MTTPFIDPPKPPLWKRTWVRVSAGIFAALVIISAASGPDEPDTVADAGGTGTSTTTEQQTTTTERIVTTTTIDPTAQAMASWVTDNINLPTRLSDQFTAVSDAATAGDFEAVAAECTELDSLVTDAKNESLPVPEPSIDRPWRAALDDFGTAARLCAAGATTYNVDLFEQSIQYIDSGSESLREATSALEAYTISL